MDREYNDVDDVQATNTSSGKTRRPRGPTVMANLVRERAEGKKRTVMFNANGHPVGDSGIKLQSFLGTLARSNIPIDIQNWKNVPDAIKNNLWDEIMEMLLITFKFIIIF